MNDNYERPPAWHRYALYAFVIMITLSIVGCALFVRVGP